jgi:hypothetical protein
VIEQLKANSLDWESIILFLYLTEELKYYIGDKMITINNDKPFHKRTME